LTGLAKIGRYIAQAYWVNTVTNSFTGN